MSELLGRLLEKNMMQLKNLLPVDKKQFQKIIFTKVMGTPSDTIFPPSPISNVNNRSQFHILLSLLLQSFITFLIVSDI